MHRWLCACLLVATTNAFAQSLSPSDDDSETPPMRQGERRAPRKPSLPAAKAKSDTASDADSDTGDAQRDTGSATQRDTGSATQRDTGSAAQRDTGGEGEERGNLNIGAEGNAEGTYKGVSPGAKALPPHPPRMPLKKGPQRMTWPGFQVKDGVPTVFLEVTAVPEYHVEDAPGAVTVTLKNTIVPLRNNRRALDVSGFATPVQSVMTQPTGKEVRVTIKTRGNERPQHHERVEDAAGGFRILFIELPAK